MWPWLVKMPLETCWCCYCCWCWWRGICWQHFGRDFDTEDCSRYRSWGVVNILKLMLMMVEVMKSKLSRDSDARFGTNFEVLVRSRFWSGCLVNILMLKTFMEKPLLVGWLVKSLFLSWDWKWGGPVKRHFLYCTIVLHAQEIWTLEKICLSSFLRSHSLQWRNNSPLETQTSQELRMLSSPGHHHYWAVLDS